MGNTASQGALLTFGGESPSMFDQGIALMDPRPQFTYQPGGVSNFFGWLSGGDGFQAIDQVPSAIATATIAAAQVPVAGTPLTLAAGAGITAGVTITNQLTGNAVAGLRAIDGVMGGVAMGPNGLNLWDPTKAVSRALQFTSVGNDSAATATIRSLDLYGFPVTETVTLANAGVATGKKAHKYIISITPGGTLSGANLSVGQSDVFGFPIRVDGQAYASIFWPSPAFIVSATGFLAAVTTAATATSGDVRGTYALQSASDAAKRMTMFISPSVANIGSINGICGVPQF